MEEKIYFRTSDNLKLCGIWNWPREGNQKAVILAHGITVDKDEDGLFALLAEELTKLGFSVFRFDFRGHGESEGKSVDMTISGELMDLEAAFDEVKKRKFDKIGLLGASFGGGIATIFAAKKRKELDFLCLWYPVLNYDHTFINPYLPWLKDRIGQMKRDFESKGYAILNSGKPFKIGKRLYIEMRNYFPFKLLKRIKVPVVIIAGDKDDYVPYKDSVEYIKNVKEKVRLITIKGANHGFEGGNHYPKKAIEATVKFFKDNL